MTLNYFINQNLRLFTITLKLATQTPYLLMKLKNLLTHVYLTPRFRNHHVFRLGLRLFLNKSKRNPMTRVLRPQSYIGELLILLIALIFLPQISMAESTIKPLPQNAQLKRFGSGWECKLGYREESGICASVERPANTYPTSAAHGQRGWDCSRGF